MATELTPEEYQQQLKLAVEKKNIDRINRLLRSHGYMIFRNPQSITIADVNGKPMYRSRSLGAAMKRIEQMQKKAGEPSGQ